MVLAFLLLLDHSTHVDAFLCWIHAWIVTCVRKTKDTHVTSVPEWLDPRLWARAAPCNGCNGMVEPGEGIQQQPASAYKEVIKKWEPSSSQWCMKEQWDTTAELGWNERFGLHTGRNLHCEGSQVMEQLAQRGCAITVHGGFQYQLRWSPEQLHLTSELTFGQEVGVETSWCLFQPELPSDPMTLWNVLCEKGDPRGFTTGLR